MNPITVEDLQTMMNNGEFHHATYRNHGTLWEGLWIYRIAKTGFRGYEVAGCFSANNPDLIAAEKLCRKTGISIGSYGNG